MWTESDPAAASRRCFSGSPTGLFFAIIGSMGGDTAGEGMEPLGRRADL
jgi:hypothetical protein